MNPLFINPYQNIRKTHPGPDTLRVSVDVPKEDVRLIRSVLMDFGSLNIIQGLLIKHLHDYAKRNEFTLANHDEFVDYICDLLCPNSGPRKTIEEAGGTNDRRRTGRVHPDSKKQKNQPAVSTGE